MFENQIRESVVAGSFYSANPEALAENITQYLKNCPKKDIANIKAIVCPHAGYIYSGQVAACSYMQVQGSSYDCAIIVAPSHAEYFDFNSVFAGKAYKTPLGLAKVDIERCHALVSGSGYADSIQISNAGHNREHSLEVQIPFLQIVFEDIKIVPIVMGSQNRTNIESLGNAIGNILKGQKILIIASTDLSHYHPASVASGLDSKVLENLKSFDPEKFTEQISKDALEMCGGGPVAAAMIASKLMGADSAEIISYQDSGDVSGDKSAVVGYVSAAFYRKG
ncbi:MAG: AmmeMemoRadiSam system protein B [Actinobacteria bacterium]|nr:AmmeMemoRadiSam system protein B [Actinomycetota bacterium]